MIFIPAFKFIITLRLLSGMEWEGWKYVYLIYNLKY